MKSAAELAEKMAARFCGKDAAEMKESADVFSLWKEAAAKCGLAESGAKIAAYERDIVTVEAPHPAWLQLLETKKAPLLAELRKASAKIKDLRFKLA